MQATEFVQSYFDAWNHRDPVAVADHLAQDGLYCDIPENAQRTHDEFIVYLNNFFSRFRHRYELVGEILQGENTLAFQYRMYLLGKPGNRTSIEVYNGAEFITLHGEAAQMITDYYDIPEVVRSGSRVARVRNRRKYAKSGLNRNRLLEYKARLRDIMESQHVYLQPDLTLPRLAEVTNCSVNHLSQVINAGFGMSFFDYVNRYRIDHAKALLSNIGGEADAVLDVAFKVGFNSNSAFYTAFKKHVGMTPAQYRRSQIRKSH
ncbi:MAG: helix-turn-helix domain-containing protein [Woeseiaceae bacterium]|nr:helix-turn-helix domain-containing protein [Woeseiaceae bacterium]